MFFTGLMAAAPKSSVLGRAECRSTLIALATTPPCPACWRAPRNRQRAGGARTKTSASAFHGVALAQLLNRGQTYNLVMTATKRIPVSPDTWRDLGQMKGAGQSYDALLQEMILAYNRQLLAEMAKGARAGKGKWLALDEVA